VTYVFASIAALAFASALGKLLKRNLELNYPSVDNEGEVEDFLASRLEREFSRSHSQSSPAL
jgi:hypothetical protein